MTDKAIICDTPEAINVFRLLSMKGRVRLESKGLKSRGFSARKMMALEMGLKPGASYDAVIAAIEAKVAALAPEASKGIHS